MSISSIALAELLHGAGKSVKVDHNLNQIRVKEMFLENWAKRIVGVMGNDLTKQYPNRAHALLVCMGDEHYRASVRAPYSTKSSADERL